MEDGEYNGLLILLGLLLLVLRRIVHKSAKLDSAMEGVYLVFQLITHIVFWVITVIVTGSVWVAVLVNFFLGYLHFFSMDHLIKFGGFIDSSYEDLRDYITHQPQRVRSYLIRSRHYNVLPGSRLLRVGRTFLPNPQLKSLELNIGDMRLERREAINRGEYWRARIIIWVYYLMMFYEVVKFFGQKSSEVVGFMPKPQDPKG